jgi:hypothetical protein
MNFLNRKVLYINLSSRTFEIKTYPDLHEYLGGLALGLKLIEMNDKKYPVVLAVGPLTGAFPMVSKTCILDYSKEGRLEETYLGGALASRIRFAGFDAIFIYGIAEAPLFLEINPTEVTFIESREKFVELGLPGRSAKLLFKDKLFLDDYFYTPEDSLGHFFAKRNLGGLVVNATHSFELSANSNYENLFKEILDKVPPSVLTGIPGPVCAGCPRICGNSQVGETEGNVLVHSLVACQTGANIYSDLGVVFSCLNALGYDYKHEELEKIPGIVKDLMEDLKNI